MIWLLFGSLFPSFFICYAAGWAVRRLAPRIGLVDRPTARKNHGRIVPLGGGLAVWLGVILPLAIGQLLVWILTREEQASVLLPEFVRPHLSGLLLKSGKLWTILGGGTILMLVGLYDDRRGLAWQARLAVQFGVAVVMVAMGWRVSLFIDAPWLTWGLSVFWIVGLINAFNMLDNMDGLSSGVATIAASILAAVMLLAPDPVTNQPQLFVGGFLLVLVGSLLGFLAHNSPPARLFLGDAGSYLIGYLLAIVTLTATFAGNDVPAHAVLAPLCVMAVPLYDASTVILIRLRGGRSPFEADRFHFSHRLVQLGMTRGQAVLTIYLTTGACGLGALLLHQVNGFGAAVVLALVGCMLTLIAILETTGRRARKKDQRERRR